MCVKELSYNLNSCGLRIKISWRARYVDIDIRYFFISLTRTTNAVRSCSERKGREKVISGLCELHMRNSFGHMRNSFISGKSCLYEYSEGEMKFHFGLLVVLLLYCSCIVKILKFIYIIEDIYSRMSKLDSHRIDSSDHDGY